MLRRTSTSRLLAIVATVARRPRRRHCDRRRARSAARAPRPPPKPLAQAVHDALAAPARAGRHRADHVHEPPRRHGRASRRDRRPLLSGASGRLWATADGRDPARAAVRPRRRADHERRHDRHDLDSSHEPGATGSRCRSATTRRSPSRASRRASRDIQRTLGDDREQRGRRQRDARRTSPGAPAYTVRISPKHDGGLTNAAELAWDAATGTPLRAAVYASGDAKPGPRARGDRHLVRPGCRRPTSRRRSRPA